MDRRGNYGPPGAIASDINALGAKNNDHRPDARRANHIFWRIPLTTASAIRSTVLTNQPDQPAPINQ
jgi:hypothetical protein